MTEFRTEADSLGTVKVPTDKLWLKTAANPEELPIEVFDRLRANVAADRSQFYKDLAILFYGANKPDARVSQGILDSFWLWSM